MAQDFDIYWSRRVDNIGINVSPRGSETYSKADLKGNVYVVNIYGSKKMHLVKYDSFGNVVWSKDIGGGGNPIDIVLDTNLNVLYVVGSFSDTMYFHTGDSVYNLPSKGGTDIFVQKLDSLGNFIWVKHIGASGTDNVNGVFVDNTGNVYVTGEIQDTVSFDTGDSVYHLSSNGDGDVFVQKLDNLGNFVWVKSVGSENYDTGKDVYVDEKGGVYIIGNFQGVVDFDPGDSVYNLSSNGGLDIFIQKLDSLGNLVWAISMGGSTFDLGENSIYVDKKGYVYSTGNFRGEVDFDPSPSNIYNLSSNGQLDVFIQKLDSSGNFVWAVSMGGNFDETVYSLSGDREGSVYVAGSFLDVVDFDPGDSVHNLSSKGQDEADGFIQKLDSLGNFVWVKSIGNTATDIVHSITVSEDCGLYISGSFQDTVDFSEDTNINAIIYGNNVAYQYGFIARYIKNDIEYKTVWDTVFTCRGVVFRDSIYGHAEVYADTICEIITMHYVSFKLNPDIETIDTVLACDSFVWQGNTYRYTSDIYRDSLVRSNGCDSILGLHLQLFHSIQIIDTVISCDSYTWGGFIHTSSGTYLDSLVQKNGCDSVVYLDLKLSHSIEITNNLVSCDSYTWGGFTYTHSGIYQGRFARTNGCDSVVYLHLMIIKLQDTIESCDSYLWLDGVTYTRDTVVMSTLDSVFCGDEVTSTLYLTIVRSSPPVRDTIFVCDSYTWRDSMYIETGEYVDELLNIGGCDSSFYLSLSILESLDNGVLQNGPVLASRLRGGEYQWLDCQANYMEIEGETDRVFTAKTDGEYAVKIEKYGCVDVSSCYTVMGLGISESVIEPSEMRIYPSLTKGDLFVDMGQFRRKVFIVVRDVFGRVLQDDVHENATIINIHLKTSIGIYYIEVSDDKGSRGVFRVMKK